MASDLRLQKGGAATEHHQISISDDGGNGIMGTTQLNDSEELLLVPAPSSDPRGMLCRNSSTILISADIRRPIESTTVEEDPHRRHPLLL